MSVRDELVAALISGFAIKNAVWVENDMPCLRLGEVADYLLSQGWRPPMRDICTPTDMKTLISGALVRDREGLFRVLSEPDAVDFENHGPFRVVWEPEEEA